MAGIFIILPADAIHGAIKEGITTWVPTMITEVYSTAPSFSVFLSNRENALSFERFYGLHDTRDYGAP